MSMVSMGVRRRDRGCDIPSVRSRISRRVRSTLSLKLYLFFSSSSLVLSAVSCKPVRLWEGRIFSYWISSHGSCGGGVRRKTPSLRRRSRLRLPLSVEGRLGFYRPRVRLSALPFFPYDPAG